MHESRSAHGLDDEHLVALAYQKARSANAFLFVDGALAGAGEECPGVGQRGQRPALFACLAIASTIAASSSFLHIFRKQSVGGVDVRA